MIRRAARAAGLAAAALACTAIPSQAQSTDGGAIFERSCASCHNGAADSRAPSRASLQPRSPEAIIEALVTGAMRLQGSRLSGAERRAVAEYLTGKTVSGDVAGATAGRCTTDAAYVDEPKAARWAGWSPSTTNTRFQSTEQAGLTPGDLPRLSLKWSFGFPDATVAWAPPTVAGGRVFVGSQNGTVYALDARTGCIRWTFAAAGGVRTALTVGPRTGPAPGVVYFADTAANAYALDAATGKMLWMRKVEDHPLARITGSLTLHEGRVYVPMSSYEESQGADPQYPCCSFRGSITALDAQSGAVVWKTYLITDPLKQRGTSTAGVPLWGPSGAGVWSPPTVDAARGALYVATGNAYSGPAPATSNAVIALDLQTGAIRWAKQVTRGDVYVTNCRAGNPNCPEVNGPDVDFGSPPILTRSAAGRDLIVIGQKSGVGWALDPDRQGAIVWQYQAGKGSVLGGIEWGSAVDAEHAYFAVSDVLTPAPGGLHAVDLATGQRVWAMPPRPLACEGSRPCSAALSAAITVIPGAVLAGSLDGALRAHSTATGELLWEFNTNRSFTTVNGVSAKGASMIGPGPVVVGGMVFVNSGYGAFQGRPGNVLLAFGLP